MAKTYEERKEQVKDILRMKSAAGRDIAPLPKVRNPKRKKSCRLNFKLFCETYFESTFVLKWSEDHIRVIEIIQHSVLKGDLFAVAMPRASGKSSLCRAAVIWSLVYGHKSFVVVIGASAEHAENLLDQIGVELRTNETLLHDFPGVCYPFAELDGISQRAKGQTYNGSSTHIVWKAKQLVLPTIKGSLASGAIIRAAGITGSIRGMSGTRPSDGAVIRPDLVLIDDPQTDESAHSPKENHKRLNTINGAILGLAGPKKRIAGVMPCTVIAKGDMADQVLDRKKCPEWQGLKFGLMKSLPSNLKLWEQYAEIRADALRKEDKTHPETKFYLENKAELDAGASASWEERFLDGEASAVQYAMNLKLRDEHTFFAEYQNQPLALEDITPLNLTADQVTAKVIGLGRGIVPKFSTKLTAMVDVQGTVLFYVVLASGPDFTSHIVDYGCYPEQQRNYFFLREVKPTLAMVKPGTSAEGQLRAGLDALADKLLSKDWDRDDGTRQQIDSMFVDSGSWWSSIVKQFTQESIYKNRLFASKGYGITADRQEMSTWKFTPGDRRGWNWLYRRAEGLVLFDTNAWKTFAAERIRMSHGEAGNMSLFSGSPMSHKMFAEHVTSEYPTLTEGNGRKVNVWAKKPNRENHWFDCFIGCLVAASEQNILGVGHTAQAGDRPRRPRRKVEVRF